MDRRRFIAGSVAALSVMGTEWSAGAADQPPQEQPFDAQAVRRMAQELAQKAYKKPDLSMPAGFNDLSYDAYRGIRFKPDRALWRDDKLPFQVQFFHRGFIFKDRVDIFEVSGGRAKPIAFSPSLFDYGEVKPPPENSNMGFAGFRLHAPMNTPD